MGRTGPKNMPGNKAPRTKAPRAKASTPRSPKMANITPAKPSNGASATRSKTSSGLFKAPKVRTTSHKTTKGRMRAPRRADGASKI